jgi:hypothetical protein
LYFCCRRSRRPRHPDDLGRRTCCLKKPSIRAILHEWCWKKWNHTARRIQIAPRQCAVRDCRTAVGFGSRCLALALKKESLDLASRLKQHFAPSTYNTWPDYVPLSDFSSRGLTSETPSRIVDVVGMFRESQDAHGKRVIRNSPSETITPNSCNLGIDRHDDDCDSCGARRALSRFF